MTNFVETRLLADFGGAVALASLEELHESDALYVFTEQFQSLLFFSAGFQKLKAERKCICAGGGNDHFGFLCF